MFLFLFFCFLTFLVPMRGFYSSNLVVLAIFPLFAVGALEFEKEVQLSQLLFDIKDHEVVSHIPHRFHFSVLTKNKQTKKNDKGYLGN